MEVPFSGYMVHAGDGDAEHSHKLFLTSWNGVPVHVHEFAGITSFDNGHRHDYMGTTQPAPSGPQHTHGYYVMTTLNDGHNHIIQGVTGPPIPISTGGHIHYFEGTTSVNGRMPHVHRYGGQTGNEMQVR